MNTSQDMFAESEDEDVDPPNEWLGVSLSEVKSRLAMDFLPVTPSPTHQVLGEPGSYQHCVRMPDSPESLFPISQTEVRPRWELVKEALGKPIQNSKDLETAIFTYNIKTNHKPLSALHQFFSETLMAEESEHFFEKILPGIIKLALEIEGLPAIRFLQEHESGSVSLTQEQAGILMANAFLSTFPRRPAKYPPINFIRLFQCGSIPSVQEKLKCFINYFRRICNERPVGLITYSRRYLELKTLPSWPDLDLPLPPLYISSEGTIEQEGSGLLEIDFANKMVGGGVLGRGSVQEEIKFLICPELVVARLFTECLDDTEALIVKGCEQFNSYEGYASTFTWSGNVKDKNERDAWGRLNTSVAAIDATYFSNPALQYRQDAMCREISKAYVGFSAGQGGGVATGNWGCGAFRGDPRLKAILQLIAAAPANVSLAYFTFGDKQLRDDIHRIWQFLCDANISVGQLWRSLMRYRQGTLSLYDYLGSSLSRAIPKKIDSQLRSPKIVQETKSSGDENKTESASNRNQSCSISGNINDTELMKSSDCRLNEEKEDSIKPNDGCEEQCKKGGKEPVPGKTCSLSTHQGREECLSTEKARWDAYRKAISECSPSPRPPLKRKISDYFSKTNK